jgi:hypothetical protein
MVILFILHVEDRNVVYFAREKYILLVSIICFIFFLCEIYFDRIAINTLVFATHFQRGLEKDLSLKILPIILITFISCRVILLVQRR